MEVAPQLHGIPPLAEGLYYARLFWMEGQPSKAGKAGGHKSEVNSGVPCNGWSSAFVVDRGGKMVTLFCPFTYEGFQVSRNSYEFNGLRHPWWPAPQGDMEELLARCRRMLQKGWDEAAAKGWQRDFDTAAAVMRLLGMEVPLMAAKEGEELKASGGKEADALGLSKPVKRTSRKGQVLAFFWPEVKSIRECMAEMGITRSNVLSQLYLLQKDHGIGYELKGDAAIISMPAGCSDPFEPEMEKAA